MSNKMTVEHAIHLADSLYGAGYAARLKERDYDPRGCEAWQDVVDALTAPRVPEAFDMPDFLTINRESLNYKAGWNACRMTMLTAAPDRTICKYCGNLTMHIGDVCYGCDHPPADSELARLRERVKAETTVKESLMTEQPAPDVTALMEEPTSVVYVDGVGAGRNRPEDCRDGIDYITVADTVYWPLSAEDAQLLRSAGCGNGQFTGPSTSTNVARLVEAITELCNEIDKHEIHTAISETSISWFKRKAREVLAAYRKQGGSDE